LALPAPAVNVDRLRKAIAKAMKGFGLNDVGLSLDYALRTAVKDADGNLVYGIRPRQGGDIDSMVVGGESVTLDPSRRKTQLVRSDEIDPEGRAEAYYDPTINTIFLSIDKVMADPSMTEAQVEAALLELLDHEMIHAMRKLDLFTNKEYDLLSRAAANKKMPDGRTFLKWAQDNYSDLSPVAQVEESVAELVRGVRKDPKLLQGKPRSLVERIARFFRNMVSALKGEKFNTFSEVIGAIESGEIGGRQRGQVRTLVETEKALSRELKARQQRGPVATTGDEAEAPVPTATGQAVADFDEAPVFSREEGLTNEQVRAYIDSSPITQQFLDPKEVDQQFRDAVDPASRSTVVMMTPNEFLNLAMTGTEFSKTERVQEMFDAGERFQPNFLQFKANRRGAATIAGHEGRHRSRLYRDQGYGDTLMPVTLTSIGGEAGELRFGEKDARPRVLYREDDRRLVGLTSESRVYDPEEKLSALEPFQLEFPKTIPFDLEGFAEDGTPVFKTKPLLADKDYDGPVFSRRPVERGGIEGNVSTRYPTGAKRTEDPLDDLLVNDYQTFVNDKTVFNKNMELIKDSKLYPILQKAANLRTNEQKAEAFVEAVKNNLLNLFDRVPAETRENSKLWYKGANALVGALQNGTAYLWSRHLPSQRICRRKKTGIRTHRWLSAQ